jgi:hypothetical protein
MSKVIRRQLLFCVLLFSVLISLNSAAQTVTVKMRLNTSTCLDTLESYHKVILCGESVKGTVPAITWDNKTGIAAVNKGGDYWEAEFQAQTGDQIKFKFVAYYSDLDHPTFHWGGWEGPIDAGASSGDNRLLIVGDKDTTLPLQYFNGWENKVAQYWRPFQSKQDTVAVYFRVNMGGSADFDPATQLVDVRGGLPLGTSDWQTIVTLSRETNSVNGGSFWSGVAYVPKASVTAGVKQEYKFVIQPAIWESSPNRSFNISADVLTSGDTTIHWNYYNNMAPSGPKVDANLLFRLKLDALEKAGLFNEALGDKVAITGAKGWPPSTFTFDTEPTMLKLTYNSTLEEWNLYEPFSKFPKEVIEYKYYISWDTSRVDPASPNYIPGLSLTDGWEEPGVTGGGNRKYTYSTEQPDQLIIGDFGYEQQFFNSIPPKGVILAPVSVAFKLNMAAAANVATNPTNPLFRPGVDSVFVQFDGCMVAITQGKTMYGTDNRVELLDPDGDGVYIGTLDLVAPTFYQLCYRITYSNAPGASITNGGGVLFGRRYYQFIHPVSVGQDGAPVWPASFELPQMEWAASDLTVENPPDLDSPTGVESNTNVAKVFALHQNYPNPFNPTTKITYSIPMDSKVKLEVFNITGQKVTTLFDGEKTAGTHSISWNAKTKSGNELASGTYFIRMQAGSFVQVKKMMLIR